MMTLWRKLEKANVPSWSRFSPQVTLPSFRRPPILILTESCTRFLMTPDIRGHLLFSLSPSEWGLGDAAMNGRSFTVARTFLTSAAEAAF